MRRCLNQMTTVLALGPTKYGEYSYLGTVAEGFEMDYMEIDDVTEIPVDKPSHVLYLNDCVIRIVTSKGFGHVQCIPNRYS